MYFFEMLLSAVSLSMDALAASLGIGAFLGAATGGAAALRVAGACGGFQFAMPLAGWFLGSRFLVFISGYDHWVAFGLLALVGGNMIRESFKPEDPACPPSDPSCGIALLTVAVATSIDALAVGVSFAAVGAPVMVLASWSGAITAFACFGGVLAGFRVGQLLGRKVEFAGGLVLCLIGANILRVHLRGRQGRRLGVHGALRRRNAVHGWTFDLAARWKPTTSAGGARYTAGRRPVRLVSASVFLKGRCPPAGAGYQENSSRRKERLRRSASVFLLCLPRGRSYNNTITTEGRPAWKARVARDQNRCAATSAEASRRFFSRPAPAGREGRLQGSSCLLLYRPRQLQALVPGNSRPDEETSAKGDNSMISILKTFPDKKNASLTLESLEPGSWINLTAPSKERWTR